MNPKLQKYFSALFFGPFLLLSTASLSNAAPAYTPVGTVVLVDFGTDLSYRGLNASSPDANGSYWNSFMPGVYLALVDRTNRASGINLGLSTPAATDSYNGPAGDTTTGITPFPLSPSSYTNAVLDAASGRGVGEGGGERASSWFLLGNVWVIGMHF